MRKFLSQNSRRGGQPMRIVRSPGWVIVASLLCVATLVLLLHDTPSVTAQASPSSISSTSGPVSWDFAAVAAAQ